MARYKKEIFSKYEIENKIQRLIFGMQRSISVNQALITIARNNKISRHKSAENDEIK